MRLGVDRLLATGDKRSVIAGRRVVIAGSSRRPTVSTTSKTKETRARVAQLATIGRWLCLHDWRAFGRWRAFTFERCRRCGEVRSVHDDPE